MPDILSELISQLPPDVSRSIVQMTREDRRANRGSLPQSLPPARTEYGRKARARIEANRAQRSRAQALEAILTTELVARQQAAAKQQERTRQLAHLLEVDELVAAQEERVRAQRQAELLRNEEVERTRLNEQEKTRARVRTAWEDTVRAIPVGQLNDDLMIPAWMRPFDERLGYRW